MIETCKSVALVQPDLHSEDRLLSVCQITGAGYWVDEPTVGAVQLDVDPWYVIREGEDRHVVYEMALVYHAEGLCCVDAGQPGDGKLAG